MMKALSIALLLLTAFAGNANEAGNNRVAKSSNKLAYRHIVKSVSEDGSLVVFDNDLSFTINWWYRSTVKKWQGGDAIHITYDFGSHQLKLVHSFLIDTAWGTLKNRPSPLFEIKGMPNGVKDPDAYSKIILNNGYVFKSFEAGLFGNADWKIKDRVMVLANSDQLYQVWNIEKNNIIPAEMIANLNQGIVEKPIDIQGVLEVESRLNAQVLQQPEATQALAASLVNYTAGLRDKNRPVGVFLFIGPTGVGKTELAKALANEVYHDASRLIRFDMSHFVEPHSLSRLIGSQPGYVNHEEGGQLTNPLLENSQLIVLLDEVEKAHPQVRKVFLPVFDEGFILDTKNNHISCAETIFIMTSNLCATEIAELYNLGYSSEQILPVIEPYLMEALSPELYNRVETILFRPLAKETMEALVRSMLEKLKKSVLLEKGIQLHIDDSVYRFLEEKGYHPLLGARPLKKLIEKRVVSALAYHLVKQGAKSENELLVFYDKEQDLITVLLHN